MRVIFRKIQKNGSWIFAIWIMGMFTYGVYVIIANGA